MSFSDETLGAYMDGELDPTTRAYLEAALASQPDLAARVARLKSVRDRLRTAFEPTLREPVPERLTTLLDPSQQAARVTDFANARRSQQQRGMRSWSWPVWGGIAASVALAVLIGYAFLRGSSESGELLREQDNELLADGALADALDRRLASNQADDGPVHIGLSFRTRAGGTYCRTFTLANDSDSSGIACREAGAWHVRALTPNEARTHSGEARQAGSTLPASLLAIVQNEIDGEPLDAAGEIAAREQQWSSDR